MLAGYLSFPSLSTWYSTRDSMRARTKPHKATITPSKPVLRFAYRHWDCLYKRSKTHCISNLALTNLQLAPISTSKAHHLFNVWSLWTLNGWHRLSICLQECYCNLSLVLLQCPPASLEVNLISSITDAWCWYFLIETHSSTSRGWELCVSFIPTAWHKALPLFQCCIH